jgi:hypothetical protein
MDIGGWISNPAVTKLPDFAIGIAVIRNCDCASPVNCGEVRRQPPPTTTRCGGLSNARARGPLSINNLSSATGDPVNNDSTISSIPEITLSKLELSG